MSYPGMIGGAVPISTIANRATSCWPLHHHQQQQQIIRERWRPKSKMKLRPSTFRLWWTWLWHKRDAQRRILHLRLMVQHTNHTLDQLNFFFFLKKGISNYLRGKIYNSTNFEPRSGTWGKLDMTMTPSGGLSPSTARTGLWWLHHVIREHLLFWHL